MNMWLLWKVLISLKNPNHDCSESLTARSHWGLIQISLNVRDIPQMVRFLSPPLFFAHLHTVIRVNLLSLHCSAFARVDVTHVQSSKLMYCICFPERGLSRIEPESWPTWNRRSHTHPSRYSSILPICL